MRTMRTGHDLTQLVTQEQRTIFKTLFAHYSLDSMRLAMEFAEHNNYPSVTKDMMVNAMKYNCMSPGGMASKLRVAFEECMTTGSLSPETVNKYPEVRRAVEQHAGVMSLSSSSSSSSTSTASEDAKTISDYLFVNNNDDEDDEDNKDESVNTPNSCSCEHCQRLVRIPDQWSTWTPEPWQAGIYNAIEKADTTEAGDNIF